MDVENGRARGSRQERVENKAKMGEIIAVALSITFSKKEPLRSWKFGFGSDEGALFRAHRAEGYRMEEIL